MTTTMYDVHDMNENRFHSCSCFVSAVNYCLNDIAKYSTFGPTVLSVDSAFRILSTQKNEQKLQDWVIPYPIPSPFAFVAIWEEKQFAIKSISILFKTLDTHTPGIADVHSNERAQRDAYANRFVNINAAATTTTTTHGMRSVSIFGKLVSILFWCRIRIRIECYYLKHIVWCKSSVSGAGCDPSGPP